MCRKKCCNGWNAIAALFILHNHWLTPALRQPFGKEPPGNVRASPRWKRDDQLDCALRPGLRERILNELGKRQCGGEDEQRTRGAKRAIAPMTSS